MDPRLQEKPRQGSSLTITKIQQDPSISRSSLSAAYSQFQLCPTHSHSDQMSLMSNSKGKNNENVALKDSEACLSNVPTTSNSFPTLQDKPAHSSDNSFATSHETSDEKNIIISGSFLEFSKETDSKMTTDYIKNIDDGIVNTLVKASLLQSSDDSNSSSLSFANVSNNLDPCSSSLGLYSNQQDNQSYQIPNVSSNFEEYDFRNYSCCYQNPKCQVGGKELQFSYNVTSKFDINSSVIDSIPDINEELNNEKTCKKTAKTSTDNPFKCDKCSKSFRFHSQLKRHIPTHLSPSKKEAFKAEVKKLKIERYFCKYCPRGFKTSHQQQKHERLHRAVYKCDLCGNSYVENYALQIHRSQAHNIV